MRVRSAKESRWRSPCLVKRGDAGSTAGWPRAARRCSRLAYTLTGNAADAEDVVREALARALPRWERISRMEERRAGRPPDGGRRAHLVVAAGTGAARPRWSGCGTPAVTPGRGLRSTAGRSVAGLPGGCPRPADRDGAGLLRAAGVAEIAELTGVRERSVRSRVSRGLSALREAMRRRRWLTRRAGDRSAGARRGGRAGRDQTAPPRPVREPAEAWCEPGGCRCGGRAVIAVPTAVVALRSSDGGQPGPSKVAGATDTPGVPAGQRVESWHGVTALVPDTWAYGSLDDWCADGGQLEPRVARPGDVSLDVKCATSTYGLSFQQLPPSQGHNQVFDWPVTLADERGVAAGHLVGTHSIGDILVEVTAKKRTRRRRPMLATVRPIGREGDPKSSTSSRGEAPPAEVANGAMRICQYDDAGLLEQSETLCRIEHRRGDRDVEAAPESTRRRPAR